VKALYDHHEAAGKPSDGPTDALLESLMADWLAEIEGTNFDPARAAICIAHWLEFFELERAAGRIVSGPRVSQVDRQLCRRYQNWRFAQPGRKGLNISGATISREMAALRAALNLAEHDKKISRAPFVPDVPPNKRSAPKDLIYSFEEVAKLIEAAARLPERRHVLHFIIILLSTHGRVEAVLDLDADTQVANGCINFLAPGTVQTKKRRSIVRMSPTLESWMIGMAGKAIEYRTVKWVNDEAQLICRPTASIKTAFEACLIEAGICDAVAKMTKSKSGQTKKVMVMKGRGGPNTLRHTIATFLHVFGIPESQIDVAAGHAPIGTNKKNYRHLRPEYLTEFCLGIERFWSEVGKFTGVYLLPLCYPKLTVDEASRNRNQ